MNKIRGLRVNDIIIDDYCDFSTELVEKVKNMPLIHNDDTSNIKTDKYSTADYIECESKDFEKLCAKATPSKKTTNPNEVVQESKPRSRLSDKERDKRKKKRDEQKRSRKRNRK